MAPVYKIALIQLHPKPMQIEANHAKACNYIHLAAAQGADLAVLPEYHLTSWVPSDPGFKALCAQSGPYLDAYRALARQLHINIVPGTIIEELPADEDEDENEEKEEKYNNKDKDKPQTKHLINVAYFIAATTGAILGRYAKKNLWHPERPHLTSGSALSSPPPPHTPFNTPLGKVGLLICWDLAFPEAFRQLIAGGQDGAKIVIVPTFWTLRDCSPAGLAWNPLTEALFLSSVLVARAFENTCAVVFVNVGGPGPSPVLVPGRESESGGGGAGAYAGMSQVAVPFRGALGGTGSGGAAGGAMGAAEGMSVVELDMQILEDAEENYRVREDMGREGWHYAHTLAKREEGKGGGKE